MKTPSTYKRILTVKLDIVLNNKEDKHAIYIHTSFGRWILNVFLEIVYKYIFTWTF